MVRQFGRQTSIDRNEAMKAKSGKRSLKSPLTPAGRALRRAALVARKTARMYGTRIYVWRNGKIVAEKP
jgi:hypothetical protein